MNQLIRQANELLRNHGFEYAFCGGWAIDLFIGKETRNHGEPAAETLAGRCLGDAVSGRPYMERLFVWF